MINVLSLAMTGVIFSLLSRCASGTKFTTSFYFREVVFTRLLKLVYISQDNAESGIITAGDKQEEIGRSRYLRLYH